MNIYQVSRKDRVYYDEYISFVCAAKTVSEARRMVPGDGSKSYWTYELSNIAVKKIGVAMPYIKEGILHESFNAG